MNIRKNISLKAYNTFGIDIQAEVFVEFDTEKGLQQLLANNMLQTMPFMILGGGSNIVFTADYCGIILHPANKGICIISETDTTVEVEAQAGEVWSDFAWEMTKRGYFGLENLVDIPGNVGAAPVQNVGAYGVEAKDVIKQVVVYEVETGKKKIFDNKECKFGYRNSVFKNELKNKYIVLSVVFSLVKTMHGKTSYSSLSKMLNEKSITNPTALQIAETISEIRSQKLPNPKEVGSVGSFFKNPVITQTHLDELLQEYPDMVYYPFDDKYKLAAGWLIEKCGWKGKTLGAVGVHDKQALVLYNRGGCTGNEVIKLANAIEADVESKFGVKLELEAIII